MDVFHKNANYTPRAEHHRILELKFRHTMPSLFTELVEEFGLKATTVSKYRLAAAGLGISETSPCCAD